MTQQIPATCGSGHCSCIECLKSPSWQDLDQEDEVDSIFNRYADETGMVHNDDWAAIYQDISAALREKNGA